MKIIRKISDFVFEVFVYFVIFWAMYIAIAMAFVLPQFGILNLVVSVALVISQKVIKRFLSKEADE